LVIYKDYKDSFGKLDGAVVTQEGDHWYKVVEKAVNAINTCSL